MLQLAERAAAGLRDFLAQRDDLVMVVDAAATDMPALHKIVEGVDQELGYAWCWSFSVDFNRDEPYAGAVVAEVATVHAAVHAKLRAEADPGWPALPPSMTDTSRPPAARLRSAVETVRALAPPHPGTVTVFALLPNKITEPAAWGAFCRGLVAHEFPMPWCAGVRFLLRDDPTQPGLATLGPRTRRLKVDFGPEALASALKAELDDPRLPALRRAQAALVSAGLDQAHRRYAAAEVAYRAALDHAREVDSPALAATAAGGIAACREQQGRVDDAERILLAAVDTCAAAQPTPFPVMLNLCQSLAMLVGRQKRWSEAEAHLTVVTWLTDILVMPAARAEAFEWRAVTQLRQGRTDEAETSLRLALELFEQADQADRAAAVRAKLADLLRRAGREREAVTL